MGVKAEIPKENSIDAGWKAFLSTGRLTEHTDHELFRVMRRMFYAGALWYQHCINDLAKGDTTEESLKFGLSLIRIELQEYAKKIQNGDA